MVKGGSRQINVDGELNDVINNITSIIEKYTDQIDLLDIIDIVDNLRVLAEYAEAARIESKIA
ncbi:MAG: hypothetical protein ACOY30_10680 [Bacillota bacterium]